MVISGRYLLLENKYYVILTVHDISKERVKNSWLQHSNEKLLCFFDNVTVGCAICDKDGKLVEVNDTYVRYMGTTSKNEAVNQLNIYTNPCINPEFKEIMKEVCLEGSAILFSTHVLELAEKLCTHVIIIKNGKIMGQGEMKKVKGNKSLESLFLELEKSE